MLSELIDEAESVTERSSTDSDSIREEAKQILNNYNLRLYKVGEKAF